MPFDNDKIDKNATGLEIAQVYVDMRRFAFHANRVIKAILEQYPIESTSDIAALDGALKAMDDHFNEITGWKSE